MTNSSTQSCIVPEPCSVQTIPLFDRICNLGMGAGMGLAFGVLVSTVVPSTTVAQSYAPYSRVPAIYYAPYETYAAPSPVPYYVAPTPRRRPSPRVVQPQVRIEKVAEQVQAPAPLPDRFVPARPLATTSAQSIPDQINARHDRFKEYGKQTDGWAERIKAARDQGWSDLEKLSER